MRGEAQPYHHSMAADPMAASNGSFALPNYDPPHGEVDEAAQAQLLDLLQAIHQSAPQQNAFAQFAAQNETFSGTSYHPVEQMHAASGSGMVTDYRGASTGSTSFSVDSNWDDHEFAFTPLVSPAMTPLSALLSPQIMALQSSGGQHVSPAEVFSPLTSPALQPQDTHMDTDTHLALLAEQASSLGLDGFQLPRAAGNDVGMPQQPSRGRGASRTATKSRPSPIMKPTGRTPKSSLPPTPSNPLHMTEDMVSTPSPIDIDVSLAVSQMPPPPLPPHAAVPATPASLMSLATDLEVHTNGLEASHGNSSSSASPTLGPKRGNGRKQSKSAYAALAPQSGGQTRRTDGQKQSKTSVEFAALPAGLAIAPEERRNSHRAAEQRRRDSLKLCFEELRPLLPHIPPEEDEEALAAKRPGEGNVAGQRTSGVDPLHPNKGVSKVALLRKSTGYIVALEKRVKARDEVLQKLKAKYGITDEDLRVSDWEENWPWNGVPGDEGHSPYSQAAIDAQAIANGELDKARQGSSNIVTRNRSRRGQIPIQDVEVC